MGKVTVRIPLITWRDGRPRFIPGVRLRKLGFKGQDLRHPDGSWYTLDQAIAWSIGQEKLVAKATGAASKSEARKIATVHGSGISVGQLFAKWMQTPRLNGEEVVDGRKKRKALAANSVRYYKDAGRVLEKFDDGLIWLSSADAVTGRTLDGVIDRIEVKHGLSVARGVRAMLSVLYSWGRTERHVRSNPIAEMETQLPVPAPRVRYGSIEEMLHLVKAADMLELPEIGDSIMLGLWTAQRQNDRLAMGDTQVKEIGIHVRQLKTGAVVLIPPAPELAARLAAQRERRRNWRVNYPHVVLDEKLKRPMDPRRYRNLFADVRKAAVEGLKREDGTELLKPMPSLADFHDQDLRDTAVTWMAVAGVDKFRIAAVTGHSQTSIDTILRHYLGNHPELARSAIASLVDWYEGETSKS